MFKSILYRLKGVRKIKELEDRFIFECLKCHNELVVHKNYGNMIVTCSCGYTGNIYTGRNTHTATNHPDIPREIKIFDCMISEHKGRRVIKGKYINHSIYFLYEPFGALEVGGNDKIVLIFPALNILDQSNPMPAPEQVIGPFEDGQFCHYLSDEEVASINPSEINQIKLQFLDFKKSKNRL